MAILSNTLENDRTHQKQVEPFEEVFQAHWHRVYMVLLRLMGDPSEAEDLAQEAFWRLYQRAPSLMEDSTVGGWLYRVATRLGLNALRARKRRRNYEWQAGLHALEHQADPEPSAQLERDEARRQVQDVLAQMKPRSALLLTLRYSGLTYAELAAVLGVAPNSIGTLLVRAEREFETLYHQLGGEA